MPSRERSPQVDLRKARVWCVEGKVWWIVEVETAARGKCQKGSLLVGNQVGRPASHSSDLGLESVIN